MIVAAGRLLYPGALRDVAPSDRYEATVRPAMTTNLWYLKRCDLFERLTPEQAERLERRAVLHGSARER